MKRPLPIWSVVVGIVLSVGVVAGIFMTSNPGALDKDALIKQRLRPGGPSPVGSNPSKAGTYGMPRGTPILHDGGAPSASGARMKPSGA